MIKHKGRVFMDNSLYYVHRIIPSSDENDSENYQLVLFKVMPDDKLDEIDNSIVDIKLKKIVNGDYIVLQKAEKRTSQIYEDCFVRFDSDKGIKNANGDKKARKIRLLNNIQRGRLIKRYQEPKDEDYSNATDICSYHVNVGHGNTSFIAFLNNGVPHLWLIDCSNKEIITYHDYSKNIHDCLQFIKERYRLKELQFEKTLVTHIHYDHIVGLYKLFSENYVKDDAEV